MLDLESTAWSKYSHAYGDASDAPALLAQLSNYPSNSEQYSEPYFSLWSALCHQGDSYTASYAAAPHILALAKAEPTKISFDFLLLPTRIEISRLSGRGPEIPFELQSDYTSAIESIPSIVGRINLSRVDEDLCITCAAAIAIVSGRTSLAEAILELEGDVPQQFLNWFANL